MIEWASVLRTDTHNEAWVISLTKSGSLRLLGELERQGNASAVTIMLPHAMRNELIRLAEAENISPAALIRNVLRAYLRRPQTKKSKGGPLR